jgi:hypothetical protein
MVPVPEDSQVGDSASSGLPEAKRKANGPAEGPPPTKYNTALDGAGTASASVASSHTSAEWNVTRFDPRQRTPGQSPRASSTASVSARLTSANLQQLPDDLYNPRIDAELAKGKKELDDIKDFVANVPGISEEQKQIMIAMMAKASNTMGTLAQQAKAQPSIRASTRMSKAASQQSLPLAGGGAIPMDDIDENEDIEHDVVPVPQRIAQSRINSLFPNNDAGTTISSLLPAGQDATSFWIPQEHAEVTKMELNESVDRAIVR